MRRERAPLLADLLAELEQAYTLWREGGLDALYDELGARDFLRDRGRRRGRRAGASAIGIDRGGRLEVALDGERRLVESGDVAYVR